MVEHMFICSYVHMFIWDPLVKSFTSEHTFGLLINKQQSEQIFFRLTKRFLGNKKEQIFFWSPQIF